MLEELKKAVCEANLTLARSGLVAGTFGNVSGVDRPSGHMVIKPSGVPYEGMQPDQMVVVSLSDGSVAEGELRPSSDTPTHLELYREFDEVGGVAHTHSTFATAWAQARRRIEPLGTTHADSFRGPIPVTRLLRSDEITGDYETNTGRVIVERFAEIDPLEIRAVLVADHGPFTWGRTAGEAVKSAIALEQVARLASETVRVEPYPVMMSRELLDKHFLRKHGRDAYYGQKQP
ncbi:MAG: L-ribulose-5-phosphate 4-epimerase AraD [Phycisphaerae bacterium]